jgi:hypothetical protein
MDFKIVSFNYDKDIKGKEIPIILFILFIFFVIKNVF